MRKYLSLGAALLAGVVLGKEQPLSFKHDQHSHQTQKTFQHSDKPSHFDSKYEQDEKTIFTDNHQKKYRKTNRPYREEDFEVQLPKQSPKVQASLPSSIPEPTNIPNGAYILEYWYKSNKNRWCATDSLGRTMCYVEKEWQWKNKYENDGTPDNSDWTSIETDGIYETSPSVDEIQKKPKQNNHTKGKKSNIKVRDDDDDDDDDDDNDESEWENYHEHDGTPDQSPMTSKETDGRTQTSASVEDLKIKSRHHTKSHHSGRSVRSYADGYLSDYDITIRNSHKTKKAHLDNETLKKIEKYCEQNPRKCDEYIDEIMEYKQIANQNFQKYYHHSVRKNKYGDHHHNHNSVQIVSHH